MKAKRDKKSMKKRVMITLLLAILSIFIMGSFIFFVTKSTDNLSISNLVILRESVKNLSELKCEEFEEDIWWSSDIVHNSAGSTVYYTWKPKNLCNETKSENCFLQKVIVNSRTIYLSTNDKKIDVKNYVQISSLDKTEYKSPEKGNYNIYLAYGQSEGIEGIENKWYCGYEKSDSYELIKSNSKCILTNKLTSSSGYFGIKVYASQSSIVDIFKIKYILCWK
ncbi:hypothetical protein J4217_00645 [Candidatus Pacearchaeota archaeon]|nr:hypothetical protein [Candidatus Pacearchaeota archaeon]